MKATLLVDCRAQLGEAVQWHRPSRRVYWTDIAGNVLWSCREDGSAVRQVALETGLAAFAFTPDGKMLAGFADGLCWLDPRSGARRMIEPYDPGNSATRMNDGAVDRQGRFVIGGAHQPNMAPETAVWSISRGQVRTIIDGVGCANGIAFSPEGDRMYFADSRGPEIFAYDYDGLSGSPLDRHLFARLEPDQGVPDGACVDAEGALWSACHGGAAVQRFLPDGQSEVRVELPVPNVTSCAIGGNRMRRLYVTTARQGMSNSDLAARPSAGGLFAVDLPVRGLPEVMYRR